MRRENNSSALVTDARTGSCLSIVRSLGKTGIKVYCGTDKNAIEGNYDSGTLNAISSYSKFTEQTFYYTDPTNQKEFENSIAYIAKFKKIQVIIPVAQRATEALSKAKKKLKQPIIPTADYESMFIATSKKETIKLAKRLKIPVPKTIIINHFSDLRNFKLKFPLVVKGVTGSGIVNYVQDIHGLEKSVSRSSNFRASTH